MLTRIHILSVHAKCLDRVDWEARQTERVMPERACHKGTGDEKGIDRAESLGDAFNFEVARGVASRN